MLGLARPSKMLRLHYIIGNSAIDKHESINHIHWVINEIYSLLIALKTIKSYQ